jgi:hypothetical protein
LNPECFIFITTSLTEADGYKSGIPSKVGILAVTFNPSGLKVDQSWHKVYGYKAKVS